MPATVHPSVIKKLASTGEQLPLADPDFYKGIPSGVAGAPADIINLLKDLETAQAQVEQGEDFLPSFLSAMEQNPYADRFGTSEYIQSLLGGDPESGASIAGYLSTAAINPAMAFKSALPFILAGTKNVKRIKKGLESLSEGSGAKKTIYHSTDEDFEVFDVNKSADGSIWFSDDLEKVSGGYEGATGSKRVVEKIIDENNLKLAGWDESDKYLNDQLIQMGYDGIKYEDAGSDTVYQIFNPDKLQSTKPTNIKRIAPDKDTWDALNITDEGTKKWKEGRKGAKLLRSKELEDASLDLANENIPMEKRIQNYKNALQKVYPLEENKYTVAQYQEIIDTLPTHKEIAMAVGVKSKSRKIIGVNDTIKSGDVIELRLDIPAYKNTNTWVVTAHKPASASARQADEVLGYGKTGYIKNVTFENMDIGRMFQVQSGDVGKFTGATMKGEWVDHNPKELAKLAKKLMDDTEWTQVGFNPKKSLTFYERGTMNPVLDAEEVIQVGNFVLAKNPTIGKHMGDIFEVGDKGLRLAMPNTKGVGRATTPGQTIPAGTKIPYSGGGLVQDIDIFTE